MGLPCIIGGIVLFFLGITGTMTWGAKVLGAESQLSNAAPGALLFVVGLFVVLITRYKFEVELDAAGGVLRSLRSMIGI